MIKQANNSLISRSSTSALKIIFQVMVLFHHLVLCSTKFGEHVSAIAGPVAVGGFLLLSGYGVGLNYREKGKAYLDKLFEIRVPHTYLILLITNVFYLGLFYYTGGSFENVFDLIISVLYIPLFSGFEALSHYIYFLADLIIYYLLFLLFAVIFKNKKKSLLYSTLSIFAVNLLIIIVLTIINTNTGSTRYLRACVCFPLGLLFACFDSQIAEFLKKFKWFAVSMIFVIGCVVYYFCANKTINEYLVPALVGTAIILLFFGADFKNKIINYFASLMLYVYISHEFFRELFIYKFPSMHQNVRALIVVALSLILAVVIERITKLFSKNKKTA